MAGCGRDVAGFSAEAVRRTDGLSPDVCRGSRFMGFYEFPPDSLVVVTSPKTIVKEWRFVVANGRVVAGCQYKEGDTFETKRVVGVFSVDLLSYSD